MLITYSWVPTHPWSGRQDSNLRLRTWKERALPTELLPLKSVVADITPEVTTHVPLFAAPTGFEPVPRTVTGWYCSHSTMRPNLWGVSPQTFYFTKI